MKLTKTQRAELRMKFGGRCAYCAVNCRKKAGMLTTLKRHCGIAEVGIRDTPRKRNPASNSDRGILAARKRRTGKSGPSVCAMQPV